MNDVADEEEEYVYHPADVALFQQSDYESIFIDTDHRQKNSRNFQKAQNKAHENGEKKLSHVYRILSSVCSPMLAPSNDNAPYRPAMQWFHPPGRSILPSDLNADEVKLLEAILDHVQPVWLKARIADIL